MRGRFLHGRHHTARSAAGSSDRIPWLRSAFTLAAAAIVLAPGATVFAAEAVVGPVHHTTAIHGVHLEYDATLDTFGVSVPGCAHSATVTTISYVRTGRGIGDDARRPIIFAFNGGPSASSIGVNVGMLGPERIDVPSPLESSHERRRPLVRNDDSILDVADLVLIDPVDTGFSRLLDPRASSYFYSVAGDADSVADTIRRWSRQHGRASSPKYLLGVSYGAVRSVEVANRLVKSELGTTLKGIILVSPSLGIMDTVQRPSNIVGHALGLTMMAATSWYHERAGRGQDLPAFARRAAAFAATEWLPALLAGSALDEAKRQNVANGLGFFTGLPAAYFLEHDLRLSKVQYRHLLLADRGLLLGESDSRYTAPPASGPDPSSVLADALTGAAAELLRSELGIRDAGGYHFRAQINGSADRKGWIYVSESFDIYDRDNYSQFDYMSRLLEVMADRPELKIFIGGGWFDTTATAGAQQYQVTRPGLDPRRVTAREYIGGHAFFTDPSSRAPFARDLHAFVSAH